MIAALAIEMDGGKEVLRDVVSSAKRGGKIGNTAQLVADRVGGAGGQALDELAFGRVVGREARAGQQLLHFGLVLMRDVAFAVADRFFVERELALDFPELLFDRHVVVDLVDNAAKVFGGVVGNLVHRGRDERIDR
ncbi:MAG: hypothetical protein AAFQ99_10155 [Pseudomonadota bacterium]